MPSVFSDGSAATVPVVLLLLLIYSFPILPLVYVGIVVKRENTPDAIISELLNLDTNLYAYVNIIIYFTFVTCII